MEYKLRNTAMNNEGIVMNAALRITDDGAVIDYDRIFCLT